MALNPFLSMGEPAATEPIGVDALNPFMMSQPEMEEEIPIGENPFAASNPFAEWGGAEEPAAADVAPSLDIFGGDALFSPVSRLNKPMELDLLKTDNDSANQRPPPPARPLPPETQNLIQSVTGQMEYTSSHLLDRIPPTRTPSPVSVRDMQSPSPTPEPEPAEQAEQPGQRPADHLDINRNKPTRPPPARPAPPPPRPAPPPVPPTVPAANNHEDINLFDAPPTTVHVKPTTKDILSLYSTPKKVEKPFDFLSDDIPNALTEESIPKVADGFMDSFPAPPNRPVTATAPALPAAPARPAAPALPAVPATPAVPVTPSVSVPNPCDADVAMDFVETTNAAEPETSPFYENRESIVSPDVDNSKNPFGITSDFANAMDENETYHNQGSVFDTFQAPGQSNAFEAMQTEEVAFEDSRASEGAAWPAEPASAAWPAAAPAPAPTPAAPNLTPEAVAPNDDVFDAFAAKFDSTAANHLSQGAWGDDSAVVEPATGFEAEAYDPFLNMSAPPAPPPAPAATPRLRSQGSQDSPEDNFTLFIRPKENATEGSVDVGVPALAPPPRPQALAESPRANPFDRAWGKSGVEPGDAGTGDHEPAPPYPQPAPPAADEDSGPPTPLFDDDVSMPLEDFPRTKFLGPGWEMHLRQPSKKKITGQRYWKKVFVRLAMGGEAPVVQLLKAVGDREPFQELPLQACYSVSEIAAQQFDQFGKIFTVKLQYVFYKERPGVRPGQVTKAERITNKLSQFAAYAIQGDYQGVKEFGSDLRKLGLPVEHAPQVSQLFKIGSLSFEDVKQFSCCIEEALFRLSAHRDRALTYKLEEVQITAVDELYVEQDAEGSIHKQIARVRLFFLGFLSGMPDVELGVNDLRRQGREVVGRHDIIPVVTEEWIRVEDTEFHACVQPEEFHKTQIIKFKPPDACYIELMRFRVRPPKNRELPLQLKAAWCVNGTRVELRADVLVPGFASRKLGQIPCEDVSIRFPIPECWIYLFRVEKHFRYGSVKSAHRRTGKIKGIERFLGAVDTLQESLIEVTSGQAKYEHQHRAIVWRMPRLPKEGQGAYTTHNLVCRMALTSFDQVPAELAPYATVEFTMPATQVSHTTVRSVSLQEHDNDPPEKCVRYLARHEYLVGIERTSGQEAPAYATAAARVAPPAAAPAAPAAPTPPAAPSSDSDSD